jgi:hypothetical protein
MSSGASFSWPASSTAPPAVATLKPQKRAGSCTRTGAPDGSWTAASGRARARGRQPEPWRLGAARGAWIDLQ